MSRSTFVPIVPFLEKFFIYEGDKYFTTPEPWRRVLEAAFTPIDMSAPVLKLPYKTVLLSARKKSIKTTVSAGIGVWWANCMDEPDEDGEIYVTANSAKHAASRAYRMMRRAFLRNPHLLERCVEKPMLSGIHLKNGTLIQPITTEFASESGSNPNLILSDEMWGQIGEQAEHLFAEMTPSPSRKNSCRVITSYAGFIGQSVLLHRLHKMGLAGEPHRDFLDWKDENGDPVVFVNKEASLFMFWDDQPRMPWQQTEEYQQYLASEMRTLTRGNFRRIHNNKWSSGETSINMIHWQNCTNDKLHPPLGNRDMYLAVGVDASTKKDRSAVTTIYKQDGVLKLGPRAWWQPKPDEFFKFEETLERYILELNKHFRVYALYYDPTQFHRSAGILKQNGIPVKEYPQSTGRTKIMGTTLCDVLRDRNIELYPDDDLKMEAEQVDLQETPSGIQLKKDKSGKKIDSIVALSMAIVAATQEDLPETGYNPASGISII